MADVFISYSRKERERIRLIEQRLRDEGLSVWFDARLELGTRFDVEIEREVAAAAAVLVCWTTEAVSSDWVMAEATKARERNILVPVFLEPCSVPVPFNLSEAANLCHWRGDVRDPVWRRVVDKLTRLKGQAAVAAASDAALPPTSGSVAEAVLSRRGPGKLRGRRWMRRPSRRSLGAIAASVLIAFLVWLGLGADERADADLARRWIERIQDAAGCTMVGSPTYRYANVMGSNEPDLVALYYVEGCGGGNNYSTHLAVFESDGGAIEFVTDAVVGGNSTGFVELRGIEQGTLVFQERQYASGDPSVNPTLPTIKRCELEERTLVCTTGESTVEPAAAVQRSTAPGSTAPQR